MNTNFIDDAFSEFEKNLIPTVTVSADINPKYDTDPGNETRDEVFLLSIVEANRYFNFDSFDSNINCQPTTYAINKGALLNNENDCFWWLRTPGNSQKNATYVYGTSEIHMGGQNVQKDNSAIRPALWIELNAID